MKAFCGLIVALLAIVVWQWTSGPTDRAAVPTPIAPAVRAPPAKVPPIETWAATSLARPLFSPDRRPAPDATGTTGALDALPRLAGTIRSDDDLIAIFSPPAAKPGGGPAEPPAKSLVVRPAGIVAGWTVANIVEGGVTLERDGHSTVLRLSFAGSSGAPHPEAPLTVVLHDKRTSAFLQP